MARYLPEHKEQSTVFLGKIEDDNSLEEISINPKQLRAGEFMSRVL